MFVATGLYLLALLLITLFSDVLFGVNAQSLAYAPLTLALIVLAYTAMAGERPGFLHRWYTSSPLIVAGLLFLAGLAAALPLARDLPLAAKDFLRWSFVWLVFAPVTTSIATSAGRPPSSHASSHALCARLKPRL